MAEEAPGQPAGRGQTRLLALSDTGHTQTHCHLVQEPDADLGGEKGWLFGGWEPFSEPQTSLTPEAALREMELAIY